jgi:hypothetical protein
LVVEVVEVVEVEVPNPVAVMFMGVVVEAAVGQA